MMNILPGKLGIAITQWGHADLTIELLKQIMSQGGVEYIVICDNGSEKAQVDLLTNYLRSTEGETTSECKCNLTLLENSANSGFSNGMNTAICEILKTDSDWVWLLNNDVSLSNTSISELRSSMTNLQPAIYSTKMLEGQIGEFTGNFSYNKYTTRFNPIRNELQLNTIPQNSRYVSGANMLVHCDVFKAIGLLNNRTFLYFEELDFIYRARKAGYQQGHIGGPIVEHRGAGSSEGAEMKTVRMYHETWSTLDFYKHHHKALLPFVFTLRTLARCLTLIASGRKNQVKSVFYSTYDFLNGRNPYLVAPDIKKVSLFKFR